MQRASRTVGSWLRGWDLSPGSTPAVGKPSCLASVNVATGIYARCWFTVPDQCCALPKERRTTGRAGSQDWSSGATRTSPQWHLPTRMLALSGRCSDTNGTTTLDTKQPPLKTWNGVWDVRTDLPKGFAQAIKGLMARQVRPWRDEPTSHREPKSS